MLRIVIDCGGPKSGRCLGNQLIQIGEMGPTIFCDWVLDAVGMLLKPSQPVSQLAS